MFIQTESTPNPATLKFLPGNPVMETGTANFAAPDEAGRSPLAQALFASEGVIGVFLGADFITVTKSGDKEWDVMKPLILGAIMEHFQSGRPVIEADDADKKRRHAGCRDQRRPDLDRLAVIGSGQQPRAKPMRPAADEPPDAPRRVGLTAPPRSPALAARPPSAPSSATAASSSRGVLSGDADSASDRADRESFSVCGPGPGGAAGSEPPSRDAAPAPEDASGGGCGGGGAAPSIASPRAEEGAGGSDIMD